MLVTLTMISFSFAVADVSWLAWLLISGSNLTFCKRYQFLQVRNLKIMDVLVLAKVLTKVLDKVLTKVLTKVLIKVMTKVLTKVLAKVLIKVMTKVPD